VNAKTLRATCIATLLFVTNVIAAAATDPAKRVGPFLDDQVVAAFRVDAGRVDAKALEAWIAERMNAQAAKAGGADAERIRAAAKDLARPSGDLEKALADFKAAGGREIYGLLRMDGVMQQQPPVLIIPIEPGADAKKLEALFGREARAGGEKSTDVLGDVMLVGAEAQRAPARAAAQANNAKGAAPANADLAAALGIFGRTAEKRVQNAFAKLGAKSRSQAAARIWDLVAAAAG
jgi:hypothetical protein